MTSAAGNEAAPAPPRTLVLHAVPGARVSLVGSNHAETGLLATRHLIQHGHRVIGTVVGPPTRRVVHSRLRGYRQALAEAERGHRLLMPPTLTTLRSIAGHSTVADVLAAAPGRSLDPVRPVLDGDRVRLPDGSTMRLPQ